MGPRGKEKTLKRLLAKSHCVLRHAAQEFSQRRGKSTSEHCLQAPAYPWWSELNLDLLLSYLNLFDCGPTTFGCLNWSWWGLDGHDRSPDRQVRVHLHNSSWLQSCKFWRRPMFVPLVFTCLYLHFCPLSLSLLCLCWCSNNLCSFDVPWSWSFFTLSPDIE